MEYSDVTDGIFRCDRWNIPKPERDWLSADSTPSSLLLLPTVGALNSRRDWLIARQNDVTLSHHLKGYISDDAHHFSSFFPGDTPP